jgi:hypothetical protein
MLVYYRNTTHSPQSIFIGIAINQWRTDYGELRTYVLIPIIGQGKPYCGVTIITEPAEQWYFAASKDIPMDSSGFGFPVLETEQHINTSKQTDEDLYFVWDDGVDEHKDRAERLYKTFRDLIEQAGLHPTK